MTRDVYRKIREENSFSMYSLICFRFGTVAYAELGDELFDTDMIDGETVTLLNPTKSAQDTCDYLYEKKNGLNEYDLESCASYQSLIVHDRQCKSRRKSEEDLFLFE